MIFSRLFGVIESTFGRVWGYVGQAWDVVGGPWSLEIASWAHFGGLLKHFGGILKPSRCILEGLEGVWRAPKQAQASFEEGLEIFLLGFSVCFRGDEPKSRISTNVDFPLVKLIFSRVGAMKNRTKIDKIRCWTL